MKLITVATSLDDKGLSELYNSAKKNGWDIDVIETQWRGFGTKLIETYNYLLKNTNVKEFIFVDAYDVVSLSTPQEVFQKIKNRNKMLVSVEKNCWPDSKLSTSYPDTDSEWKYINSGTYYAPRDVFMELIEKNPPLYSDDDQLWMTNEFLNHKNKFVLDYDCEVFQCYSFISEEDFGYENKRLQNLKTKSQPVFIHGNGKTDLTKIINLLWY